MRRPNPVLWRILVLRLVGKSGAERDGQSHDGQRPTKPKTPRGPRRKARKTPSTKTEARGLGRQPPPTLSSLSLSLSIPLCASALESGAGPIASCFAPNRARRVRATGGRRVLAVAGDECSTTGSEPRQPWTRNRRPPALTIRPAPENGATWLRGIGPTRPPRQWRTDADVSVCESATV